MSEYFFLPLIFFLAGFIQGLAGFGAALVGMPLLTIVTDVKSAVPLMALCGMVQLAILSAKLKAHFEFKNVATLLVGSLPGLFFGLYILKNYDERLIKLILAVLLVVYSSYSLFAKKRNVRLGERFGYMFGFLSGALGGALSTNGPTVIVYAALRGWDGDRFKATLTGFFFISGIFIVAAHAVTGLTTVATLKNFALCAPFIAAGTFAGLALYGKLEQGTFRKLVYVLVFIMGLLMFPG